MCIYVTRMNDEKNVGFLWSTFMVTHFLGFF